MTFQEYQDKAKTTAIYPNIGNNFIYPTLGLVGEAGELADKVSKIIRDENYVLTDEKKIEIIKEMGDVLWYMANLAEELGTSFEDVASRNLEKLKSRQERNELGGSGDNR